MTKKSVAQALRIATLTLFLLLVACVVMAQTTNVLYRFQYDGLVPSGFSHGELVYSELIQGADGNFYGTTTLGGSGGCLGPFGVQGCGTIFKVTSAGTQTILFNFPYDANTNTAVDGIYPYGGLVQGKDGNFYGVTTGGGDADAVCNGTLGCGVIFKITPAGAFSVSSFRRHLGHSGGRGSASWPVDPRQRRELLRHHGGRRADSRFGRQPRHCFSRLAGRCAYYSDFIRGKLQRL